MLENGYTHVDLYQTHGFVRPLLVGRAPVAAAHMPDQSQATLVGV